ncbi:MAG: helix-turn-helix transcriptional regulator [Oscillospiraceae bacterium]|nr:helix-turn-helix transcriptional regulator [Oscillospiraceae bacterium]
MGYEVIREPYILFETTELLYQFVNNIPFKSALGKRKNETPANVEDSLVRVQDQLQAIADEVCAGLDPNDPALQHFFAAVDVGRRTEALCLARCLTASFTSFVYPGLDESIREICDTWHILQAKGAWIKGYNFRSLIMSVEEGCPGDLIEQICALELPAEFQLSLYRALRCFDRTMAEFAALIRPVAEKLSRSLEKAAWLRRKAEDHWLNAPVEPLDFLRSLFGPSAVDGAGAHTAIIISTMEYKWISYDMEESIINVSGRNFMMVGCSVTAGSMLESSDTLLDSASATLKILSDRRRLDVLRRLGQNRSYCHELADIMGADPGNMSRTLTILHDCGFLRQQREAQRYYYQTDRAAIHDFFQQVEDLLFR